MKVPVRHPKVEEACAVSLAEYVVETADLLVSFATSLREAAYQRSPYLARYHAMQARLIVIDLLKSTAEMQAAEMSRRERDAEAA